MGVKTEIKNLNSFRAVKMAIEYETERQIAVVESGRQVEQVTMGWDERSGRTILQRSKEGSEDYRYFPEPDLPPIQLSPEYVSAVQRSLPETPWAKRDRFVSEYGLRVADASVLVTDAEVAAYYEACVCAAEPKGVDARTVHNWVVGELFRLSNETGIAFTDSLVTPQSLAELLQQVEQKRINARTGKAVLDEMFATGKQAAAIIEERGLAQIDDVKQIGVMVDQVLAEHSEPVAQYLAGKETVIGFLIGQVMRASRGKAEPQVVRRVLRERLETKRKAADGAA
jgi:aspartyl-tRNA(Asn)/glutamyl-tRNA(Gln) amidotransferase subunit B